MEVVEWSQKSVWLERLEGGDALFADFMSPWI